MGARPALARAYFFPWNVTSCEWVPVTVLTVDVTVTEPPDAIEASWLAVSVTVCV
jgi:hypothetical protein